MDRYAVSPEDCLVLLAIKEFSSLREAARRLSCDPAGLLRKVQRLAKDHGFLRKTGGRWALTSSALPLVVWTKESVLSQNKVLNGTGTLRIAATAWFAERVLIPELRHLATVLSDKPKIQFTTPAHGFERALIEGDCDFVVACHPPENPVIAHKQIMREPWSVILEAGRRKKKEAPSLMDLRERSFVRHTDANPTALFPEGLPFEVNFSLSIDNLVGIRAAVQNGLGWSFVPTALVAEELKNGKLEQVGKRYELDRKICLWWLRGGFESRERLAPILKWVNRACQKI